MDFDKMGEKRATGVISPEEQPRGAHPDWVSYTHCPNCTTNFWSTYPPTNKAGNDYDSEPALSVVSEITFCPECGFNSFTPAYLMNAVPFTDTEILHNTPTTTTPATPSGDMSLNSF